MSTYELKCESCKFKPVHARLSIACGRLDELDLGGVAMLLCKECGEALMIAAAKAVPNVKKPVAV